MVLFDRSMRYLNFCMFHTLEFKTTATNLWHPHVQVILLFCGDGVWTAMVYLASKQGFKANRNPPWLQIQQSNTVCFYSIYLQRGFSWSTIRALWHWCLRYSPRFCHLSCSQTLRCHSADCPNCLTHIGVIWMLWPLLAEELVWLKLSYSLTVIAFFFGK